jgi:micrococcal nuclease|tara:strand:+ start:1089 stop:1502 length:414 start_codon:yes stop_codon:yes gene_type:complete
MYEYKVTVDRVIDGDTVDVDIHLGFNVVLSKQRVRLHGIDTPESRTRNKEEKVRGLISKEYLKNICESSSIRLKSKDRGKFGRILGVLYKDDETISINQKMCEEGFAVPYFGGNKDELEALHMINKQKLINQGLLEG